MNAQSTGHGKVLVGLGANSPGPWGRPAMTLTLALRELERRGITVEAVSNLYETAAMGAARQPPYVNQVALVDTSLPAPALLRLLKQIEARAGRRGGRPWGARTLDLDIIDYKGMTMNWSGSRKTMPLARVRPLVLPHPQLEQRPFVLRPLLDVAPDWRHPVSKLSARELWRLVPKHGQGSVLKRLS
ncbi:2-amino-4-hydroxy-6-hydroxymethyldihydropteridine diphosphokinase [Methyloceanibacter sp.]|uniref:2-amino-4-hydroxy-6- hydroxymethyldihydropteridine diphosphokinase n=1 Tax=Methyloceanibacter sp. TaxID=1965321 RepID=UPI003D6C8519